MASRFTLLTSLIQQNPSHLRQANASKEEIDSGQSSRVVSRDIEDALEANRLILQYVSRLDDEAPSGPNYTGSREGNILGEGEIFCRSCEVTDTSEDDTPLVGVN